MKQSEIGIIAVIVVFSVTIASVAGQALLGQMTQKGKTVGTVAKISSSVTAPDSSIFYTGAKNPTVQITIGQSSNVQPFSGGQ